MSGWGLLGTLGGLAGGYYMAEEIAQTGDDAATDMGKLAGQLQNDSQFTGYSVSSPWATSTVDASGSTNLGVGREEALSSATGKYHHGNLQMQNAYEMLQGGATNPYAAQAMAQMGDAQAGLNFQQNDAFHGANLARQRALQDTAGREQDIYNRAMAMQQPALDAQRAQTNAQEFAAGRGGVMGSQFGGSGEDAAMARAQAQAQNAASFQAMGQAQQEAMNQANMSTMFGQQGLGVAGLQNQIGMGMNQMGATNAQLGQAAAGQLGGLGAQQAGLGLQAYQTSFLPMEQQMALMGLAQNNANMAQTGQLTGAGYASQLGLGGIQAQINAQKAASELYGNLFGAVINNSTDIGNAFADLIS